MSLRLYFMLVSLLRRLSNSRSAACLVVLCLAASACGGDADSESSELDSRSGSTTSSSLPQSDSEQLPEGDAVDGEPGSPVSEPPPPGAPQSDPRQPQATTVPPGEPAPATSSAPQLGPVGSYAPFYLRPAESQMLVVEVGAQQGAEPAPATLDRVASVLGQLSGKQVILDGPARLDGGSRDWSARELSDLADRSARTSQGAGGAAVVRLLFLHGTFDGEDGVLGAAVRSDLAAVFIDRVEAASGPVLSPDTIEDAVTMHEVGHLLGLVDNFLDTGREDPEHPGHSRNRESVMYWAVESDLIGQVLSGGPPRDFDADDLADLATIRSGG